MKQNKKIVNTPDFNYSDIADILTENDIDISYINIDILKNPKKKRNTKNTVLNLLSNKVLNKIKKNTNSSELSNISIYTDGSCKINDGKNRGTFAVVVVLNNKITFEYSESSDVTTNNKQELSALIIASQIAQSLSEEKGIDIYIYSDSQYSINTLFGNWKRKANHKFFKIFDDMNIDKNKIHANWVRGHNGNILNEYADKLCELAYYK